LTPPLVLAFSCRIGTGKEAKGAARSGFPLARLLQNGSFGDAALAFSRDCSSSLMRDLTICARLLRDSVNRFLGTLKRKEETVMRMRFGIDNQDAMTLEEIGARLDVTRERIRQIEAKAIRHLKHPARLGRLLHELGAAPPPQPELSPRAPNESDDEAGGEAPTVAADTAASKRKPAVPATARSERRTGSKPTALDKLLDQARATGATVEDYPEGDSRRLWVHITNTPDNRSRKLVRKLIELGFEFWPGKGYWR